MSRSDRRLTMQCLSLLDSDTRECFLEVLSWSNHRPDSPELTPSQVATLVHWLLVDRDISAVLSAHEKQQYWPAQPDCGL